MLVIVDYRSGNIRALTNIFEREGIPCRIARTADELLGATKILLPGVGAFDQAMGQLESAGFVPVLEELVRVERRPVLGICVGMQLLAKSSDEGICAGLGWIEGRVRKFEIDRAAGLTRLPHMGWNDVNPRTGCPLFAGLGPDARFYFLHSYYFECACERDIAAESEYGSAFACAVQAGNVFGVQFHPEKSHRHGVQLLKNFALL